MAGFTEKSQIIFYTFVCLIFFSCASMERERKIKEETKKSWVHRPVAELEADPYFKSLIVKEKNEDGAIRRSYIRRGKFLTSFWGPFGYDRGGDCYHDFIIKDDIVQDYIQLGTCRYFPEEYKEKHKKGP